MDESKQMKHVLQAPVNAVTQKLRNGIAHIHGLIYEVPCGPNSSVHRDFGLDEVVDLILIKLKRVTLAFVAIEH